jgi:LacI family transcriptional regulator
MQKRPTVHDVARAAGVSAMTVSRAINDKPGVGEQLRGRIKQLADELGYRPNQNARSLAGQHSMTIGLVVPDIANAFFAQIARGAEDTAYERGYTVLLVNTGESVQREQAALDTLWQKDVDGIILCSARMAPDELQQQVARFPAVVLVNRELPQPPAQATTININDRSGATAAVRHCVQRGCSRIALAAGPATSYSAQRRLDGYRAALSDAGLWFDPELLEHCTPDLNGGYHAAAALLGRRPKLDAIIGFNDMVAIGALQYLQQHGYNVPADVAVIGFDDIPLAGMVRPALTSVRADLPHLGRLATERLLQLIEGDESVCDELIEPELISRESV